MKYILIVAMVALLAIPASSQNDSGIFLTIKCGKKMPKETVMLTLKAVCLASSPIIVATEFESVTEVKQNKERIHFDLALSAKAVQVLRQLKANLPEATFALVVDKEVFAVFAAGDLAVNSTFRFEGFMKDQQAFFKVQEKLKALVNSGGTQKL
jgi:hypothetical protein